MHIPVIAYLVLLLVLLGRVPCHKASARHDRGPKVYLAALLQEGRTSRSRNLLPPAQHGVGAQVIGVGLTSTDADGVAVVVTVTGRAADTAVGSDNTALALWGDPGAMPAGALASGACGRDLISPRLLSC